MNKTYLNEITTTPFPQGRSAIPGTITSCDLRQLWGDSVPPSRRVTTQAEAEVAEPSS